METLVNPSYQPQEENEVINEKLDKIKKDLGINLEAKISIDDIKDKLKFKEVVYGEKLVYLTKHSEEIWLWDFEVEENKILYIYSINSETTSQINKIKNLWTFILQRAIKKAQWKKVYLMPLDDVSWFYKKVLKRLKNCWIIKDYNSDWLETEIIKN